MFELDGEFNYKFRYKLKVHELLVTFDPFWQFEAKCPSDPPFGGVFGPNDPFWGSLTHFY